MKKMEITTDIKPVFDAIFVGSIALLKYREKAYLTRSAGQMGFHRKGFKFAFTPRIRASGNSRLSHS